MPAPSGRVLKTHVRLLLREVSLEDIPSRLLEFPPAKLVGPLAAELCNPDPRVRWKAVIVLGKVTARWADEDPDAAREVIRRFMWNLNDESGGIGWGAAEAMGAALAEHPVLAREYAPILLSYINEKGNFLDHPVLLRGAVWAVGFLARSRPELLQDAPALLIPLLDSEDMETKGSAAWALQPFSSPEADSRLRSLVDIDEEIPLFNGREIRQTSVGLLAQQGLHRNSVEGVPDGERTGLPGGDSSADDDSHSCRTVAPIR